MAFHVASNELADEGPWRRPRRVLDVGVVKLHDTMVRRREKLALNLIHGPSGTVKRTDLFGKVYALTATIGFKRPVDIFIPKEVSLGG